RQLHSYKHRHVDLTPTHSQIDIAHLSLFSYHTTPTTELYTLSLHDALPIFSGLTGRREADDFAWFESYVPAYEARNGQMWRKSKDRKSTRLNSSHRTSSYAVFCLKKKSCPGIAISCGGRGIETLRVELAVVE